MLQSGSAVIFPDAVTERGQKHLQHLLEMHKAGWNAVILFFAGRNGIERVRPQKKLTRNTRKCYEKQWPEVFGQWP
jgi:sugar fermentation stimulation protein A